jgi:hypothetical protein
MPVLPEELPRVRGEPDHSRPRFAGSKNRAVHSG